MPIGVAGAGLIGAGVGAATSLGATALQQQYNLKNWNRTNAYNSPKEQLARIKAAGLNPNAMYTANKGGLTSTAPDLKTPNVDPSLGTQGGMSQWMQSAMLKKQMEVQDAEIENKKANTENVRTNTSIASFGLGLDQKLNPDGIGYLEGQRLQEFRGREQGLELGKLNMDLLGINKGKAMSDAEVARVRASAEGTRVTLELIGSALKNKGLRIANLDNDFRRLTFERQNKLKNLVFEYVRTGKGITEKDLNDMLGRASKLLKMGGTSLFDGIGGKELTGSLKAGIGGGKEWMSSGGLYGEAMRKWQGSDLYKWYKKNTGYSNR